MRQALRNCLLYNLTMGLVVDLAMHPLDAAYPGIDAHGPFATPSGAIMSAPFMLAATLLDARRTRDLCRDVAREWPGGPAGFADLARAVRGQDWPALRAAAYDGPAYDRHVNLSAVLTSPT